MTKEMNDKSTWDRLLSAVQAAGSVLLLSHVSPDGDTVGSALAMKRRLERMGRRATLALDGEIPRHLAFLPGSETVCRPEALKPREGWDLAVAVDVSCKDRLGSAEALFDAAPISALIDHHATNPGFGGIDLIDGEAPATAVLMYRLFAALGQPVDREEAICLYTALSTDTGNFVYESTNAECFRMMGGLMEAGLPLAEYSRLLFRQKERPFVKLLGKVLPSLRMLCGGAAAALQVSLADMDEAEAGPAHADGMVDYAIDIRGVKMAYFARETVEGRVKVSLRALEPYRVDGIAERFGGGGHRLASGCTLDLSLAEAARALDKALEQAMAEGGAAR